MEKSMPQPEGRLVQGRLKRAEGGETQRAPLQVGCYRAPSVSSSSLRILSSMSSRLKAFSHSSHRTSSTAGRPSSETSTRESSRCTTCICSVFTRKFWSLPQLGQVSATRVSSLVVNRLLPDGRSVRPDVSIVGDGFVAAQ
jgi:hypothetical protein